MTMVSVESQRFELMETVAEKTMHGFSATAIAKELNIPRKEVMLLQDDFRTALSEDGMARDMARDHLNQMGKHYDSLIKKFYDLVRDIDSLDFNHQVAAQKNATLRSIAELEAKRLDAYQKAGLLDSAELGDELAAAEEKQQIIIDILTNDLCAVCKPNIAYKLSKLTGKTEAIDVEVVENA